MVTTYKSSGVNISNSDLFVKKIKPLVRETFTKGVIGNIGNFGGFFEPQLKNYKYPLLISSVDGVGTKIKIAASVGKCVNDIAVCGAVPMFFLDYYATGKLNPNEAVEIVRGLSRGCKNNNCALIGGETAEMPGIYSKQDFDLAGAIVGITEKDKIVNYKKVKKGDLLIGLASNGLHTNGYSLVRKIFDSKKKLLRYYNELTCCLYEELLKVHKSYLKIIQFSLYNFKIKSISHITGGGIEGNTKRVVPDGLKLKINWDSWERPFIFKLIKEAGNVPEADMRRTFNLGIGLIFIISGSEADKLINALKKQKIKHYFIGEVK